MLCYSGFSIDSIQNNLLLPHISYDQLYAYLLDEEYDTDAIRDDIENVNEDDGFEVNSNIYRVFNNHGIFTLICRRVVHRNASNPYASLRMKIPC